MSRPIHCAAVEPLLALLGKLVARFLLLFNLMNILGQFISQHIDFSVCRVCCRSVAVAAAGAGAVLLMVMLLLQSLYGSYRHK